MIDSPSQFLTPEVPEAGCRGPSSYGRLCSWYKSKTKKTICNKPREEETGEGVVPPYFWMESENLEFGQANDGNGSRPFGEAALVIRAAKKTVKRHLPSNRGDLLVLLFFCGFFVLRSSHRSFL